MERLERLAARAARDFNRLTNSRDDDDLLRTAGLIQLLTEELDASRTLGLETGHDSEIEPDSIGTTVLVVEPDPVERARLAELLLAQGCSVLEAVSSVEALEICDLHPRWIDLLLTNAMLNGASGRELAELAASSRPEMAVVYMSGYADEAAMACGVLGPAVVALHKPVTATALADVLRRYLEPQFA